MDPGLLKAAEVGANLGQEAVVTAIHQRQQLGVIMNQFMAKYDLLLTPTMPMTAFAVNENAAWGGDGVDIGWTPFTLTFNLTRQPAATIPCGLDREGLPIGLQIVGGPCPRRAGAARGRRLRARAPDPGAPPRFGAPGCDQQPELTPSPRWHSSQGDRTQLPALGGELIGVLIVARLLALDVQRDRDRRPARPRSRSRTTG